METNREVRSRINEILDTQSIAVLGTTKNDEPYSCLVAFAVTEDLKELVFATMRKRLKYQNIMANPRVTLTMDDRDKRASDFNETTSVTLVGSAGDVISRERQKYAALLLSRHPSLMGFVNSPDCAIIRVRVDKIYMVSEFESVIKIEK